MARSLPKLDPSCYVGHKFIHWIFSVDERKSGWLTDLFHLRFREILLHICVRESLITPAYCLMPDHCHLLLVGLDGKSSQRAAVKLLRQELNRLLAPGFTLQHQAYDHLLRTEESAAHAFPGVLTYIFNNPCRKSLSKTTLDWAFSGSLAPGFTVFDLRTDEGWKLWQKLSAPL